MMIQFAAISTLIVITFILGFYIGQQTLFKILIGRMTDQEKNWFEIVLRRHIDLRKKEKNNGKTS